MANLSTSSMLGKHTQDFYNKDKSGKLFSLPFSEEDVLMLQEIFITSGVHTIKTKNVIDGRKIIQTILNSLNYYHNIGSIASTKNLPHNVCDIINHIALQNLRPNNLLMNLEDFFDVHPCFDFIWIELTQDIKKICTIENLKKLFDMYHVEERMPVFIVTYDEE